MIVTACEVQPELPYITQQRQGTQDVRCQPPPYREMSPQYHSASCKVTLFPLARLAALGFGLGGFGGKAVKESRIEAG